MIQLRRDLRFFNMVLYDMTKSIVLCADDYGQAPAITDGILALLQKKRLSAVSCLVNSLFWQNAASALMRTSSSFDIGLHFNLTEGKPLSLVWQSYYGESFSPLSTQLRRSWLRQMNKEIVIAEFEAQLDAFQAATGQLPHFIDGHQHVHQFAVIRDAIFSVYDKRLRAQGVYLRLANPVCRSIKDFKQFIINLTGGFVFKGKLERLAIPHNASFSGSYSFAGPYRAHFQAFLEEVGDRGLIMCHPALKTETTTDLIATARFEEYSYLASDQFLEDCSVKGVKIGQFLP